MRVASAATGGGRRDKRLPPGFRFHPTDEELVLYYLKRKICRKRLRLNAIAETDVYKFDPEELPGLSILKTGDRQWFFFSPRDRKYPNGARTSRGTRTGYWKATGKDRTITCNGRNVGIKKTLVFYRGRAPNGQRTDWVMHEYTLHEDELNRCQNAVDHYALYKAFKKSGPGPKNGEQYGAPFREEEWADDEPNDVTFPVGELVTATQQNQVPSVGQVEAIGAVQSPLARINELLNSTVDEPEPNEQHIGCPAYTPSQVAGEEDTLSDLLYSSSRGLNCADPVSGLNQTDEMYNELANFDFTQTGPPLTEASEVTSAANDFEPEFFMPDDFLELSDLIDTDPTSSSIEKPAGDLLGFDNYNCPEQNFSGVEKPDENLTVEDYLGWGELDIYHDAPMYLNDTRSVDQGNVSQSCTNFLGNNVSGEPYNHIQAQANCQIQPHSMNVYQSDSQLWVHDQQNYGLSSSGMINGTENIPTSGVVNSSMSSENQEPGQKDGQGSATSQLSSALWSFIDSIPTTPASAAENVLVHRAFERMSSFSKLRVNSINNSSGTTKKAGRSKKLFIFSIIGIACAISWALVGSMDVWGR